MESKLNLLGHQLRATHVEPDAPRPNPNPPRQEVDQAIERLATEKGGTFVPSKVEELLPTFLRIGDELRSQYSLAYGPTNASRDGTFRQIRVVAAHKSYKIRCRTGYFALGGDLAFAGR